MTPDEARELYMRRLRITELLRELEVYQKDSEEA
jgi:hypothetical protein